MICISVSYYFEKGQYLSAQFQRLYIQLPRLPRFRHDQYGIHRNYDIKVIKIQEIKKRPETLKGQK